MSIKDKVLGALGTVKHYLGIADKQKVDSQVLEKRFNACQNCPNKKNILGADVCGVCGCPLFQKLPLLYDPKETEIQGNLVTNKCPDPNGAKW